MFQDKKYKYSLKSPLNRPTPLTARGAALGAATSMSSLHSFLTSPAIHRRFSQDNGLHSPTGSGGSTPISPITEALSPSDTNSSPGSAITYVKDSPLLPLHTSYSGITVSPVLDYFVTDLDSSCFGNHMNSFLKVRPNPGDE